MTETISKFLNKTVSKLRDLSCVLNLILIVFQNYFLSDFILVAPQLLLFQLRKRYEAAVQERNDRGIHLIERNEEVCIFYEKVNIHGKFKFS